MKNATIRFICIVIVALFALSFITQQLWNALLPAIFNLPTISFLQAAGLLILSRLLFGHLLPRFGRRGFDRRALFEKWHNMSDEEREQYRHRFDSLRHGRCSEHHHGRHHRRHTEKKPECERPDTPHDDK
ncbi:hypothetical protein [Pragia fontium]|uniref:hypothetical protein n=1 Tax=Pragia fontium TaxID=82985 RepID=UPI00069A0D74|nr:hypothetical protein [Pragia fontium]